MGDRPKTKPNMKQTTTLKSFILAAAASLGLTASAFAQEASDSVVTGGLLGTRYTAIEGNYYDLHKSDPAYATGFTVAYNQPLTANIDLGGDYSWTRGTGAARLTEQELNFNATAYKAFSWGKPFVTAGAGWVWDRATTATAAAKDDSFAYKVGTGVEFVVGQASFTPYVNFARAASYNANELQAGVLASYHLTREWAVTGRLQYDVTEGTVGNSFESAIGIAYRF